MLDGDTGNTTSTEGNVAADVMKTFAALREAGPEPEITEAVEAAPDAPGEPEVTETEAEVEAPVKERIVFKIGDEEVDEDTLIEARKSGLRQADYTKKTQELSTKAQKLEQERAAEREQTLKHWQALEDAVASQLPKEPDWNALRTQVKAGAIAKEDYDRFVVDWTERKAEIDAIKAEKQKAEDLTRADRQKQAEATAKQNFDRVMELIPDWKDEGKRQKDWGGMTGYVKEIAPDIEPDSLLGMHPALFKVLRDAHQYHLLQQSTTKPKVVKVDATLKPGSSQSQPKPSGSDTALRRVAQTHSDADGVAAFRELRKQGAY